MRFLVIGVLACVMVLNCAPAPTGTVDVTKARSGLMLASGASISQANVDDYNPQMVHMADGTLILVFGSNRTCSPCTAGQYHMFVATSTEPYDFYTLPPFNNPVVVNNAGAEISLGLTRGSFSIGWQTDALVIAFEQGGTIKSNTIMYPNLASGSTAGAPAAVGNTSRNSDKLLYVDFKSMKMVTRSNLNVVRISAPGQVDSGTVLTNGKLITANNAAAAHYAYTGYTDAVFYPDNGGLSSGRHSGHANDHFFFNESLADSGLLMNYVSVFRTPAPVLDLFLFSAQTGANSTSDLYAVDSHTAAELFLLDATLAEYVPLYDYGDMNYPPYRIFQTTMPTDGFLGGVMGADALCNSDYAGMPDLNVYYKAMIVDNQGGRSSPMDSDIDWVLQPSTLYIKSNGASIMTTNASALFTFGALTTSVGAGNVWTGLTTSWSYNSTNACDDGVDDWWDNTAGSNGAYGNAGSTAAASIFAATQTCNNPAYLYCVEQPGY